MTQRFALFALFGLMGCWLAGAAAAEPSLKPSTSVAANVIRLGDLFADAGARGADVVAPAPPPGSRTIFDAAWLARTAGEHGLHWQPSSRFDEAVVERATRVLGAEAIAARLLATIGEHQSIENAEIELDNGSLRLLVPTEAAAALVIEGLKLDPRTGRFSATVSVADGLSETERLRVTGRLNRFIDIPVLARPMAPGEPIAPADIEPMRLRADRVAADTVSDARDLVGKTPRRSLRAGEPLRSADVQVPVVVHKGDLVTIVLETPAMRLTAQGKALDDGGANASIRVSNTKSNRVIDATVLGANLVTVNLGAQVAAR